jgi:hypothetical protein
MILINFDFTRDLTWNFDSCVQGAAVEKMLDTIEIYLLLEEYRLLGYDTM